jgi:serine/threonine protein kinase
MEKMIGEGVYGQVYLSGDHVVKVQQISTFSELSATVHELNYYACLSHPNIATVTAWAYSPGRATFIALNRGISVKEALSTGQTTLLQVARDVISALDFLHRHEIVHKDIKEANMIFFEGRTQLIDFGISTDAYQFLNDQGMIELYMTDIAYTDTHKDPEYVDKEFNNIKSELFAVGISLRVLGGDTDPEIKQIIDACTLFPVANRMSTRDIAVMIGAPIDIGTMLETTVVVEDPNCTEDNKVIQEICMFCAKSAAKYGLTVRAAFLGIHLFHRVLRVVIPDYINNKYYLPLVGIICIFLAASVSDGPSPPGINDMMYSTKNSYSEEEFDDYFLRIMQAAQYIITTTTYWDFAFCFQDLPELFIATCSCYYDPTIAPVLTPRQEECSSKYVSIQELLKFVDTSPVQKSLRKGSFSPTKRNPINKLIVNMNLKSFTYELVSQVSREYRSFHEIEYFQTLATVLHFREYLKHLSVNDANEIYTALFAPKTRQFLEAIIGSPLPETVPPYRAMGVNPFAES